MGPGLEDQPGLEDLPNFVVVHCVKFLHTCFRCYSDTEFGAGKNVELALVGFVTNGVSCKLKNYIYIYKLYIKKNRKLDGVALFVADPPDQPCQLFYDRLLLLVYRFL